MRKVAIAAAMAASLTAGGLLLHAAWGRGLRADAKPPRGADSSAIIGAAGDEPATSKISAPRAQDRRAQALSVDERARAADDAPSTEPPSAAAEPRPSAPDARAFVGAFDARLVAEAVDPAWSREAETDAARALEGEAMQGSTLVRADCRSTMCRVDVAHESDEALERFMEVVPKTAPFHHGGVAYRMSEEGGTRTVVFMAREGHELPSIDAVEALSAAQE